MDPDTIYSEQNNKDLMIIGFQDNSVVPIATAMTKKQSVTSLASGETL